MLVDIIIKHHKSTKRDYLARMTKDKPKYMTVARHYGPQYWDGDRMYGYGGYKYDNRWIPIAEKIISYYGLNKESRILDIGCGKGFLAYEIEKLLPGCTIRGCDISKYALTKCKIKSTFIYDLRESDHLSQPEKFDMILCINVLHNFTLLELENAFKTINANAKQAYIVVDSYRNEQELFNLQCWALTAESFFRQEEWEYLFKLWDFIGDWEFIYYE